MGFSFIVGFLVDIVFSFIGLSVLHQRLCPSPGELRARSYIQVLQLRWWEMTRLMKSFYNAVFGYKKRCNRVLLCATYIDIRYRKLIELNKKYKIII